MFDLTFEQILQLLAQGGLAIVVLVLLWLLVRTQLRQDKERDATIGALKQMHASTLKVVGENTAAIAAFREQLAHTGRGGRRVA